MTRELRSFIFFLVLLCASIRLFAQDDLLKELEQSTPPDVDYAFQTFKGTRLVNGQSVETKARGALEFIFAHRFGSASGGLYEMFGLDQAYVRIGLEYGITDNLGIGIGRNSYDKTLDGFLRYKVARQRKGAKNFPVTMTTFLSTAYKASPKNDVASIDRLAYVGQLLIARKFSPKLSLQLMPTIVHRNAVQQQTQNNNDVAIGFGSRFKITKSIALTTEYYYLTNHHEFSTNHSSLGFGIDIETGGHVFQLVITNTQGLTERAFITETNEKFFAGGIHLGFNVTRTFQLKKR